MPSSMSVSIFLSAIAFVLALAPGMTGATSRIPEEEAQMQPIVTLGAQDIERSQALTVEDLLCAEQGHQSSESELNYANVR